VKLWLTASVLVATGALVAPESRAPWTWTEQAKISAGDAAWGDSFGYAVSLDGDTALIGAYLEDAAGPDSGSAYVFVRTGSTWTQQAKLTASDAAAQDWFGRSVSLSGDTAVVGAYGNDDDGFQSGCAYVFVRSGTTWTQQAKLTASDAEQQDRFGWSVAADGDRAIVAAPYEDTNGTDAGAAYIFLRTGTSWAEEKKVTDGVAGDLFGYSVALYDDKALVGAPFNDGGGAADSGAAYLFRKPPASGNWWRQKYMKQATSGIYDLFGWSVALWGDRALVGCHLDDHAPGVVGSGTACVFAFDGSSWSLEATLEPADPRAGLVFGGAVALSDTLAVLGAWGDQSFGTYLPRFPNPGNAGRYPEALVWEIDDDCYFTPPVAGSVYVFLRSGSVWSQEAKFKSSDKFPRDLFGWSVAVDGDTALVGKVLDWSNGLGAGAAYAFVRSGPRGGAE
jgi:hypothetical protein